MKKIRLTAFCIMVTLPFLSGCTLSPEANLFERVTLASANQLFEAEFEDFSDERLLLLLDSEYNNSSYSKLSDSEKRQKLRQAFAKANKSETTALRSQIQDRLIAASNQRCNIYATYLKRVHTYQNSLFGTATTLLGGAGAMVTGANSARILSGLAGISSGTRAELNQAMFESLATSIIIPSIQIKRKDFLETLITKRSGSLLQYTIEGAIADVITYHGYCSIDAGIGYASKSIHSFEDIGIKKFTELQTQLGTARNASNSFTLNSLPSLIVAKKILNNFKLKLESYKEKVDSSGNTKLQTIYQASTDLIKEDSTSYKDAKVLDEKLAKLIIEYSTNVGAEKFSSFSLLQAQQIEAKNFQQTIDLKHTALLLEFKKKPIK